MLEKKHHPSKIQSITDNYKIVHFIDNIDKGWFDLTSQLLSTGRKWLDKLAARFERERDPCNILMSAIAGDLLKNWSDLP